MLTWLRRWVARAAWLAAATPVPAADSAATIAGATTGRAAVLALAPAPSAVSAASSPARAAQPAPAPTPTATPAATPAPPRGAGGLVIAPGTVVDRDVLLLAGPLDVYGTVRGSVFTLGGDVVLHPGSRVTGQAISVFGAVRAAPGAAHGAVVAGGEVGGTATRRAADAPDRSPLGGLVAAFGWAVALLAVGIPALRSEGRQLQVVADTVVAGVGRALGIGLLAQLLVLPVGIGLTVALAVTVVGILGIPLVAVALAVATVAAGIVGFLAVAYLGGRLATARSIPTDAFGRRGETSALVTGVLAFAALWTIAALAAPAPVVATVLRAVSVALTWVAITAGVGAIVLSRAGTRRPGRTAARGALGGHPIGAGPVHRDGVPVWQTPTPIAGVVAARRPTAVPRGPA